MFVNNILLGILCIFVWEGLPGEPGIDGEVLSQGNRGPAGPMGNAGHKGHSGKV